jgi:alkanesulfonate monooxygenase SsuD/methylene tetrahydromethanopterin reductase-like flavin-dependent oxidoreductase (luciferase family)
MGLQKRHLSADALEALKEHFVAGRGGFPLVRTPEPIVDALATASRAVIDGVALSWVEYLPGVQQWIAEVLPLLEQAGLRQPLPS